ELLDMSCTPRIQRAGPGPGQGGRVPHSLPPFSFRAEHIATLHRLQRYCAKLYTLSQFLRFRASARQLLPPQTCFTSAPSITSSLYRTALAAIYFSVPTRTRRRRQHGQRERGSQTKG